MESPVASTDRDDGDGNNSVSRKATAEGMNFHLGTTQGRNCQIPLWRSSVKLCGLCGEGFCSTSSNYLKCSADSRFSFGGRARPTRVCVIPYFGLISWQPFSQYTPPSAVSGDGIGEFTAISRSCSK